MPARRCDARDRAPLHTTFSSSWLYHLEFDFVGDSPFAHDFYEIAARQRCDLLGAMAFLLGWWVKWTVHVFAGIARNLWQAVMGLATIARILWRMVAAPPCPDLLGEFLEKRCGAPH